MSKDVEKMVNDALKQFEPIVRQLVVDASAAIQAQLMQALSERIPAEQRPKRRGRPPGSKNKKTTAAAATNGTAVKRGPGRPRKHPKPEGEPKKRVISEAHRKALSDNLRKAREQKQKNLAAVEKANKARSLAQKKRWAEKKATEKTASASAPN